MINSKPFHAPAHNPPHHPAHNPHSGHDLGNGRPARFFAHPGLHRTTAQETRAPVATGEYATGALTGPTAPNPAGNTQRSPHAADPYAVLRIHLNADTETTDATLDDQGCRDRRSTGAAPACFSDQHPRVSGTIREAVEHRRTPPRPPGSCSGTSTPGRWMCWRWHLRRASASRIRSGGPASRRRTSLRCYGSAERTLRSGLAGRTGNPYTLRRSTAEPGSVGEGAGPGDPPRSSRRPPRVMWGGRLGNGRSMTGRRCRGGGGLV